MAEGYFCVSTPCNFAVEVIDDGRLPFQNTTLSIVCSSLKNAQVKLPISCRWSRERKGRAGGEAALCSTTYQCSALDVGCTLTADITSFDDSHAGKARVEFQKVRLLPNTRIALERAALEPQ